MRVCIIGCINYEYILVIVSVCCDLGRGAGNPPFNINLFENLRLRCIVQTLTITVTLSNPIRYLLYYDPMILQRTCKDVL